MAVPSVTTTPPELRALVVAQLGRVPELADELAGLLAEKERVYKGINESAPVEFRKVCAANLERALIAFAEGREVPLDAVRKTARAQARLGIPLAAMLRAFRISGTFIYEAALERTPLPCPISPELMLRFSTGVWKIIDSYSEALAVVYREVETETARHDEQARLHVLDGVLDGRTVDSVELDEAARVLGLPTSGTFVVVVADRVGDARHDASALLAGQRWRSAWRPGLDAETGIVALERGAELSAVRGLLAGGGLAVGMSTPVGELAEVPTAVQRARIARRCLSAGSTGVAVYGAEPVTTLVAGAPTLARELARDLLAEILACPPAEQEVLLSTLRAWYDGGGSAKDAAERLFVHPNTVRYRLRRIQELTGRDLTHPRAVAELYTALEAVRLDPALQ
ncbi:PucR family transcriptional regulator [Labedaea rhizosphaerae]|uniref:PucR-like helix-turn-helix protein n=1 Tax=Labedaea rhizosphaerae TaxID=598644 RepID=A0A4R6SLP6_LABRH|nr:helix-turn-helix domain-containing protein [Labedaea rhizosphaerae]TDQ04480.1 PucR-like helix-turn-helix protein [Labedaea rhizosphaerae]